MIDCKVCIHYNCCCSWCSKEIIDSTNKAMNDGDCLECRHFEKQNTGTWSNYSSTMMECSNCKKHVPYHRYTFCPHCGSKNKT